MQLPSSRVTGAALLLAALVSSGCHRSSGSGGGGAAPPATFPAFTSGFAVYLDADRNGEANAGDTVRVDFGVPLALQGAQASDFALPVAGDSLGAGASLAPISGGASALTVVLGAAPHLKARQRFDPNDLDANAASGIHIAPGSTNVRGTAPAAATSNSDPTDIVPGFVLGEQTIDDSVVAAELADLDCDGVLDLVCARVVLAGKGGGGFTAVCTHRGLGDGTFVFASELLFTPAATSLALADVDRDGRIDVALGTEASDYILRNDSSGPGNIALSPAFELSVSALTRALAFADIDLDGDQDLVAADTGNVRVYANEGAFSFAPGVDVLGAATVTEAIALGDLDRDGKLDLCLAHDGPNSILLGDGAFGFSPVASVGAANTRALALGDVDRDGDLDLITGNAAGADIVWLGDGAAGFAQGEATLDQGTTRALALVDFDGDGALDWLRVYNGALRVAVGDGLGHFITVQTTGASLGRTLPVGDVDGDGDWDAALIGGELRIAHGSLAGAWGTHTLEPTGIDVGLGRVLSAELADWDADGDLDLAQGIAASGGNASFIRLRTNQGDGSFAAPVELGVDGARVTDLVFGDVDQDGDLDLLAARIGADTGLWLQDDAGEFIPAQEFVPASRPSTSIALGDIDGDGDLDYVLGTLRLSMSEVMLNDGFSGDDAGLDWQGFSGPVQELGAELTSDVELCDLDCDGDLDLLAANGIGEDDVIYRNDGGTFVVHQSLPSATSRCIALVDVDRDGDSDYVRGTPQHEQLWLNNGDGTFTFDSLFPAPQGDTYATLARDLDGDGRPDLVAGHASQPGVTVHRGNGAGFAGTGGQALFEAVVLALAIGDLDRDGDLEIIAPHANEGGTSAVYSTR